MSADVFGNLEGEATVQGSIKASASITYRSESSRHQVEELSWGDILRKLRDSLGETSLSHVRTRFV
jgi:hypothetical protein